MASRKIRDEVMMMTISINSDPAQQAIYELRKENVEYAKTLDELKKKKEELGRRNKSNATEWDELTKKIKENEQAISTNKDRMEDLRRALDVSKMTMSQLKKEALLLKQQLGEVIPGSESAKQYQQRLEQINNRMAEVTVGSSRASNSFRNLADRFNHYSGIITAVMAVLVGFGISVQSIIDRNNKMADAMSGVEKNVGMTRKEVEELTRSFSDLDTRTSKLDLLSIATGGGRMGVAKENIRDFVEVTDKAIVALGDSWKQTPDKIAESIGKVTTLYAQTRNIPIAESINQIGSALNELAADGAASEQNVNDFATRVGALPEKLKPTIADALGLGAAFEESGIDAERSGTAYSNFVKIAANNVDKFAKVMRLPIKEVKDLINTNPTEFFLRFAKGLKGMDATDLAKTFEYLKINDQYITSILGAASEKNERFRETLELSNKSLKDGTSLTEEFNKVNTNAAAVYEKLQKKIGNLFTSAFVSKGLEMLISSFALFIGVNENAEEELSAFGKTVLTVTRVIGILTVGIFSISAAISAYNLLLKESVARQIALEAITKLRNITTGLGTALQQGWNLALGLGGKAVGSLTQMIGYNIGSVRLQTAATNMQTTAQERLNLAMAKNPIGLIITLIGLAVTAYLSYKAIVGETEVKQRSLNEVMKEGTANAAKDISQLEIWYKTATNTKLSIEERTAAIQKLKAEYPQYFKNISDEIIMNGKARNSYLELRDAIIASARSKAAEAELESRAGDRLKRDEQNRQELINEYKTLNELKSRSESTKTIRMDGGDGKSVTVTYDNEELIKGTNKRIEKLLAERKSAKMKDLKDDEFYLQEISRNAAQVAKLDKGSQEELGSNYLVPEDEEKKKKTDKNKEERHQRELDKIKKRGEDAKNLEVQIQLEIEDAKIEAMKDGYDKEIDTINLQEQRKLAEIEKKKIGKSELDAVQRKIDSASKEDKAVFQSLKDSWLKNNTELENLKLAQIAVFDQKRKQLQIKSDNEFLKDQESAHQKAIGKLNRQRDEELAQYTTVSQMKNALKGRISNAELRSIRTWEDGKVALTKVYQKQELDLHIAHIQEMVSLYEGLDMSILNKDQQEQVLKFIEDAKNKIAELQAKKTEGDQPDKGKGKAGLGNRGSTDILGMSPEDWDTFFTNLQTGTDALGTAMAAVAALQSAFSAYYSFVQAQEQAQAAQIDRNAKKQERDLKRKLDRGQINQEQYEEQLQFLQEETERKKAKLEYESAKRQRVIQIGQIIANTAQAIMSIWAQVPKFDFGATAAIMTGVVGALGALQVATVLKTPLPEAPGYEDGFGYGQNYNIRREQDGKQFNVTRKKLRSGEVYRPTHFIAAEDDRVEFVIANSDYKRFSPQLKHALNSEIGYSRGFQAGYYPYLENKDKNMETTPVASGVSADVIERNTAALNKVAEMKPRAYIVKDMDLAKDIIDVTDEYNSYKNSARK